MSGTIPTRAEIEERLAHVRAHIKSDLAPAFEWAARNTAESAMLLICDSVPAGVPVTAGMFYLGVIQGMIVDAGMTDAVLDVEENENHSINAPVVNRLQAFRNAARWCSMEILYEKIIECFTEGLKGKIDEWPDEITEVLQ